MSLVLPDHIIYNDDQLQIGLSCHPATAGHTIIFKQPDTDLFSLPIADFVELMSKVSTVASILGSYYGVGRCALVTEGSKTLSLLPLHGPSKDWIQVTSDLKEFHEVYPGYISSQDGPKMDGNRLYEICSKIQKISGISEPFDYNFEGDANDKNLFARIVRGELQQWRVWEDDHHVAFLTPFANTPGFTVVVPRKHLSSDIFSIKKKSYAELVGAAHTVARILKKAFGTRQCGMIFEGFEINYAYIKIIPIHQPDLQNTIDSSKMSFHEKYQGYVSSLDGPVSQDFKSLTTDALNIRKTLPVETMKPPRPWSFLSTLPSKGLSIGIS